MPGAETPKMNNNISLQDAQAHTVLTVRLGNNSYYYCYYCYWQIYNRLKYLTHLTASYIPPKLILCNIKGAFMVGAKSAMCCCSHYSKLIWSYVIPGGEWDRG